MSNGEKQTMTDEFTEWLQAEYPDGEWDDGGTSPEGEGQ